MPAKRHGMSGTPIYGVWHAMMQRCYDKNSHAYGRYGGRGVVVCDDWKVFEGFFKDMGFKPKGLSLERLDVDGNYSKANVVWASAKVQANNRKSNVILEHNGKKQTMQQWCDELDLKLSTVWARLNTYGYSVDKALTKGWRATNAC